MKLSITLALLFTTFAALADVPPDLFRPDSSSGLNSIQEMLRNEVIRRGFRADLAEIAKHDLGTRGHPVRTSGSLAQKAYFESLRCEDGIGPVYVRRNGSAGTGPYGFMLDSYSVVCIHGGEAKLYTFYADLYHLDNETRAVDGFRIEAGGSSG